MGGVIHGGIGKNLQYKCIVFDYSSMCQNNLMSFSRTIEAFDSLQHIVFAEPKQQENKVIKEIFDLFDTDLSTGIKFQIAGKSLQLLGLVYQFSCTQTKPKTKTFKNQNKLKEVLTYIKQNYDKDITLIELADIAQLSQKYFCTIFKQLTGKTPIDYLIYYRVECAAEQLVYTDDSVIDIALSCGFNDVSYFIKKFSEIKQVTPLKYRNSFKAVDDD